MLNFIVGTAILAAIVVVTAGLMLAAYYLWYMDGDL